MTPDTLLHRLAAFVLRSGIRLAPAEAREWGNAMLGELQHIEGNWAAVAWALGGAGVLAKHALVALLLPGRNRQSAPMGNPLVREAKMHKASVITGGACLAAVLLFFLAPVFRQGFRVSLAQWQSVINVGESLFYPQKGLESLARRVEKRHDAEGMAFVAARLNNRDESVRLANEAVRLDPKLIWIWGVVGWHFSGASGVPARIKKLEQSDPGNALPCLILAQRADMEHSVVAGGGNTLPPASPSAAWLEAMAGAFSSTRIDDYTGRLRALARTVARRYGLNDPYFVVEMWNGFYLPGQMGLDSTRYAMLIIKSGEALEARGDTKGAIEKYLQVAHFVRMFESHDTYQPFFDALMPVAYRRLAAVYTKMGNGPQSAYFAGLARTAEHKMEQHLLQWRSEMENQGSIFGITAWNQWSWKLQTLRCWRRSACC
jgi:hypothetical protein